MEDKENILFLIPQKPPFVMIDQLLHSDEIMTRSSFRVTTENVFTINSQFTEAGLLENIAQTAAARAGYIAHLENKPVEIGYIGAVTNFEIFDLPQINDEIITEIKTDDNLFNVSLITGKVWSHDKLIAQCEMKVFKVDRQLTID